MVETSKKKNIKFNGNNQKKNRRNKTKKFKIVTL
jgi:hypothetical protein